jgi:hypothetical protein
MTEGTQTVNGAKTFSSGVTAANTSTSSFGRVISAFATESSAQYFNTNQFSVSNGGSKALTVTGGGMGLALCNNANTGALGLFFFSSLGVVLIAASGSWTNSSGAGDNRLAYSDGDNLLTVSKHVAGTSSYSVTIISNSK